MDLVWRWWCKVLISVHICMYRGSGRISCTFIRISLINVWMLVFSLNGKCVSFPGTCNLGIYTFLQKLNFYANASKSNISSGFFVQKSDTVYPMWPTYYLSRTKINIIISWIQFQTCAPSFGTILEIAKSRENLSTRVPITLI